MSLTFLPGISRLKGCTAAWTCAYIRQVLPFSITPTPQNSSLPFLRDVTGVTGWHGSCHG
ncbi:MAG TPA: hypothetical protein VNX46_10870 [Candidatus Acidoferrum sp.]|nr:hypothetical protein [Candidatus Acidoferrum sp.]HWY75764.1 hypothetical protein [Verrucomicrobiae bacterium]